MTGSLVHAVFDEVAGEPLLAPSDPCVTWGACTTLIDGDYEVDVHVRDLSCPPRASIQRWAARELGVSFEYVRVLARWGRLLTRQDVWNSHGADHWSDLWVLSRGLGFYFEPRAYYKDEEVGRLQRETGELVTKDGSHARNKLPWDRLTPVEVPAPPSQPPAEWLPLDNWPVWEFCTPRAAGATPLFVVETM